MKTCVARLTLCGLALLLLTAAAPSYRLPVIGAAEPKVTGTWQAGKPVTLDGLSGVFAFLPLPDGKRLLVSTDGYLLQLVDLPAHRVLWKAENKMQRRFEFDGASLFDVSADGAAFLTEGQSAQGEPRHLVERSVADGKVLHDYPVVHSTFFSELAGKDNRYPGPAAAKAHLASGQGAFWVMTPRTARYAGFDRRPLPAGQADRIFATYEHAMTGPNLYDHKAVWLGRSDGSLQGEYQNVADPKDADFSQPAGFTAAHFFFPCAYDEKADVLYAGTSFGRVHAVDKAARARNAKQALVEKKDPGKVLYVPTSDSRDLETKDAQIVRHLELSPRGDALFVTAGYENGFVQLYVAGLPSGKELARSGIVPLQSVRFVDDDHLVFGARQACVGNVRDGTLAYCPEPNSRASVNRSRSEVVYLSGGATFTIVRRK